MDENIPYVSLGTEHSNWDAELHFGGPCSSHWERSKPNPTENNQYIWKHLTSWIYFCATDHPTLFSLILLGITREQYKQLFKEAKSMWKASL